MHNWFNKLGLLLAAVFCLLTTVSSGLAPQQFAARLGLALSGAKRAWPQFQRPTEIEWAPYIEVKISIDEAINRLVAAI
jgi:hypothetical protein